MTLQEKNYEINLERCVADVSRIIGRNQHVVINIQRSLKHIGRVFNVSHAYYFKANKRSEIFRAVAHWHDPSVSRLLHHIYTRDLPNWRRFVNDRLAIKINDCKTECIKNELVNQLWGRYNVRAIVFVPLFIAEKLNGFICLANTDKARIWKAPEIITVHSIALLFSSLLEHERRQKQWEREIARLRFAAHRSQEGIILLNNKFKIEFLNEAGRDALQCLNGGNNEHDELQLIGNVPLTELIHKLLTSAHKSISSEFDAYDDTHRAFQLTFFRSPIPTGSTSGILILSHEITHLRMTQEQLMQSSKMASLGTLAAGIAHELNNPLTVVIGQAQLLKMKYDDTKFVEGLAPILHAGERAKTIVENILEFSRTKRPEDEMIDINRTISNTLSLLGKQFVVQNIDLIKTFDPNLPQTLGNKGQLQQLFLNIIQNSCDAVASLRKMKKIEISTCLTSQGSIEIRFQDNGSGMPEEVQTRVFDPFYTTKPPGKGTGLGLSICQDIVERHNGHISIDSNESKGTTFIVEIPVKRFPSNNITPNQIDFEGKPIKCILINPKDRYRKMCEVFENSKRMHVEMSSDLPAAIEKLQLQEIDLVFIDIKRQHLVASILRGSILENWKNKIVFITEFILAENVAQQLFANGYKWLSLNCSKEDVHALLEQQSVEEKVSG